MIKTMFSLAFIIVTTFLMLNIAGSMMFDTYAPKLDYDQLCTQKARELGYPIQTRYLPFVGYTTNVAASPAYLETILTHKTVVSCYAGLFTQDYEIVDGGYKIKNSTLPSIGSKEIATIVIEG